MNLLVDKWVPSTEGRLSLRDILVDDKDGLMMLPHDDLEFAAYELLISIASVILGCRSTDDIGRLLDDPMKNDEFEAAISPWLSQFELLGDSKRFMQIEAEDGFDELSVHALFQGLWAPSGNNHVLFGNPHLIRLMCPSCAAIALYNAEMFGVGGGSGYMRAPHGAGVVRTLVKEESLRRTVIANLVIFEDEPPKAWAWKKPSVIKDISRAESLFWNRIRFRLRDRGTGVCDYCGESSASIISGVGRLSKSGYESGFPRTFHPFCSYISTQNKKTGKIKIDSMQMKDYTEIWLGLLGLLLGVNKTRRSESVENWFSMGMGQPNLMVSGYDATEAKVNCYRTEFVQIHNALEDEEIRELLTMACKIAELVNLIPKKFKSFSEKSERPVPKAWCDSKKMELIQKFYHDSSIIVYERLQRPVENAGEEIARFFKRLKGCILDTFDAVYVDGARSSFDILKTTGQVQSFLFKTLASMAPKTQNNKER